MVLGIEPKFSMYKLRMISLALYELYVSTTKYVRGLEDIVQQVQYFPFIQMSQVQSLTMYMIPQVLVQKLNILENTLFAKCLEIVAYL